jgi:hypothetical protein
MSEAQSEEEFLLKQMIQDRDQRITRLNEQTEKYEAKTVETIENLRKTKNKNAENLITYVKTEEDFRQRTNQANQRIAVTQKDVLQQNGGLHTYANILKEAAPESADSSYVIRMQSQLCKAMHSLGILEHQLEILNNYSAGTIGGLKSGMAAVIDEKTQVELKYMNQLVEVDNERQKMNTEMKLVRQKFEESQRSLLSQEQDDEDENDEKSDEEIDEDLLREILSERKEDIRHLEEENVKQARQIDNLSAKIKALNGGTTD